MKITSVAASLRYSKALGKGRHKTVELSAEAELGPNEDWQKAQQQLYQMLGQQLKTMWAADSTVAPVTGSVVDDDMADAHYCREHDTPYQRFEKNGDVWYSHRYEGGWCNERRRKQANAA